MKYISILWIGDVYGEPGRKAINKHLLILRKKHQIDLVIANVENATHGKAISLRHTIQLANAGVDVFTNGNHFPKFKEVDSKDFSKYHFLFPHNLEFFPKGWKGTATFSLKSLKIQVTNLLGQTFINIPTKSPFLELKKIVENSKADLHFVDFHAEATAEKASLAHAFDGKITAIAGTHTHVLTADERLLPKGTFFISDLGMTGAYHSIIGADIDGIVKRQFDPIEGHLHPATTNAQQFSGVILKIDCETKKIINFNSIFFVDF